MRLKNSNKERNRVQHTTLFDSLYTSIEFIKAEEESKVFGEKRVSRVSCGILIVFEYLSGKRYLIDLS
jgi:hypothetical protein